VKEVTQGVDDVELEDEKPEAVPLPASPPPEAQDLEAAQEGKVATQSPHSRKSATVKDVKVSPAIANSAAEPITADTSADPDSVAPVKAPRKTRKLPSKAAKPSSKAAKKAVADQALEPKGKTLEEVVDLKEDGESG